MYLHKATFINVGAHGDCWSISAVGYNSALVGRAYILAFYDSVKPTSGPNNRFNAFPIRCLAY